MRNKEIDCLQELGQKIDSLIELLKETNSLIKERQSSNGDVAIEKESKKEDKKELSAKNTTKKSNNNYVAENGSTSKLIIDRTTSVPYIFIARRRANDAPKDNVLFIDNQVRDMFFDDCRKEEATHDSKYKYSITSKSSLYEKWSRFFD